jgi:hypothetical protein
VYRRFGGTAHSIDDRRWIHWALIHNNNKASGKFYLAKFEGFTPVTMKKAFFWDIKLISYHIGDTLRKLKIEAINWFESLINLTEYMASVQGRECSL